MILCHIPLYVFYSINSIKKVKQYIKDEMDKKGYKIKNHPNINRFKIIKHNHSLNIEETKENLEGEKNQNLSSYNGKKRKKKIKKFSKFFKKTNENPPKKRMMNEKIDKEKVFQHTFFSSNSAKGRKRFRNAFLEEQINDLNTIESLNQNENKIEIKKNNNITNTINKENIIIANKEFPLILIHANNEDYQPLKSNYILNNFKYEEAIIHENRKFCRIIYIFLICKNNILNLIVFNPPLELKPLRICIFIFNLACDLALNALFYFSDNISDKYHYTGKYKLLFTLVNNLTISLALVIVSFILLTFFQELTQSNNKIEQLFKEQDDLLKSDKNYKVNQDTIIKIRDEISKITKCLKIKILFFFIFELIIMLFFFYYATAFCHVYESTQISWLLVNISSYLISLIISLAISLIGSIFYKISIKYKIKILYRTVIFVYAFE